MSLVGQDAYSMNQDHLGELLCTDEHSSGIPVMERQVLERARGAGLGLRATSPSNSGIVKQEPSISSPGAALLWAFKAKAGRKILGKRPWDAIIVRQNTPPLERLKPGLVNQAVWVPRCRHRRI